MKHTNFQQIVEVSMISRPTGDLLYSSIANLNFIITYSFTYPSIKSSKIRLTCITKLRFLTIVDSIRSVRSALWNMKISGQIGSKAYSCFRGRTELTFINLFSTSQVVTISDLKS